MSTYNPYGSLITQASLQTGVSPQTLTNLISAESSFNPNAVSSAGAQGLTQLMPGTAADLGVTNAFDPAQSINAGAQYLQSLIQRFGSTFLGAAAYNEGPTALQNQLNSGAQIPASVQAYANQVAGSTPSAATGNIIADQVNQIASGNVNPANLPTGIGNAAVGAMSVASGADSWIHKLTGISPINLIAVVIGAIIFIFGGALLIGNSASSIIAKAINSDVGKAAKVGVAAIA